MTQQCTAQSLPGTFYWPSAECLDVTSAVESNPKTAVGTMLVLVLSNSLWVSQQVNPNESLEPQGVTFGQLYQLQTVQTRGS